MGDDGKMSFIEHLEELRKRLIKSAVAVLVGMIACWFFKDRILSFLLSPLYEAWSNVDGLPAPGPLNFTDMLEPFIAYLKLSAVGGLFVASPFVLYQLWKFVAPGLYPKEKKLALPFVFVSSVLFIGGALMAYSFVFPFGFRFFLDLAAGQEMIDLEAKVVVIAGPEPVEAQKNPPPSEALVAQAMDAGPAPDAGEDVEEPKDITRDIVRQKPNPTELGAKEQDPRNGDAGTWFFERLLGYFGKEDCATFAAEPGGEKHGVKLVFTWNEMRCGGRPDLKKLTRDDEPIQLEWAEQGATILGQKRFEADDEAAQPGERVYKLRVPADPHAMRLAPVLMVKDYLSLALKLLLAFGVVFELPILISFLAFAGIVNYKQLLKFSRWFIPISFIVGAMLTPPDALTQVMLALPLIALYFISVLVAYLFGERKTE